jgi:hypothetical protein
MPTRAYRVEVKSRAAGSLAFRWEIYLGATATPVAASFNLFRTAQQAEEAGAGSKVRFLDHPFVVFFAALDSVLRLAVDCSSPSLNL